VRRCTEAQRDRNLTWILVCTNARDGEYAACAEVGGDAGGRDASSEPSLADAREDAVVDAVTEWLRDEGLFWTEAAVVETSCLGLCSEAGAAVGFQPRDEWYENVRPADVPELLAEELASGAD